MRDPGGLTKRRRGRPFGRFAGRVLMPIAALALALPASAGAAECANDALRQQQNARHLPDCRAWEQVSPIDKNGYDVGWVPPSIVPEGVAAYASAAGDKIMYRALGAFGDQDTTLGNVSLPNLAQRGADGWATESLLNTPIHTRGNDAVLYSDDLSRIIVMSGVALDNPFVYLGHAWLYTGSRQYTVLTENGQARGLNASGTHFLTAGKGTEMPLRDVSLDESGQPVERIVSVLPDGETTEDTDTAIYGSLGGSQSDSGDRVVFRSPFQASNTPTGSTELYMRTFDDPGVPSVWVSEPEDDVADAGPAAKALFWGGSDEFDRVLFSSQRRLTADSTADPRWLDTTFGELYLYDHESGDLRDISRDTDRTPYGDEPGEQPGGDVLGVLGTSDDLSVVYFAARGTLGTGQGVEGETNIFRWEDGSGNGTVTYVTTSAPFSPWDNEASGERLSFSPLEQSRAASVSADGRVLTFRTAAALVPEDDDDRFDLYVYDHEATTDNLSCASCTAFAGPGGDVGLGSIFNRALASRFATADGSAVVFDTAKRLVAGDVNGVADVYRYDVRSGEVALLSTGSAGAPAYLLDASADGRSVFFVTRTQLVGQDSDALLDVYVARADGGLPEQASRSNRVDCVGDECQGGAKPGPGAPTIGSADGVSEPPAAKLSVRRPALVRGAVATLRVRPSTSGRVTVAGARVRRASRSVRGGREIRVKVRLRPAARAVLRARGGVRARVTVTFQARSGEVVRRTATVQFARPERSGR